MLGSVLFEIFGDFSLLAIFESVAAVIASVILLIYILKSKDLLKAKAEEREAADAKENAENHKQ